MKNIIYLITLSIFSLFINQYVANRGIFPIDSFLAFDSAFNIISGQHPFKDYWLITGPFVDYIQAAFFLVFGVNWSSYVLHASVLNMLLALFSFKYFLNIGLKNYYAFIYSLGISVLAYPTIGTPFIDHHAVIFCIMACFSISLAIKLEKNIFWISVPIFLTFSFFSKQIPSPYFALLFIIFIFIYFYSIKKINKEVIINLFFGLILSSTLITSVFFINKIPVNNFLTQYIFYPFDLGDLRIDKLKIDFKNLISQFKYIYLALVPLTISIFNLIKIKNKSLVIKNDLNVAFLFLSAVAILIYCQLLTKNQILIFFLIPIACAYSHAYIIKYYNKNYLVYFILTIFIFTTGKYHIRFNHDRKFIELSGANFELAKNATLFDKRLQGLKWITPSYSDDPAKEIALLVDVKKILMKNFDEKIIITDYQIFSSLLNNKFSSPNKWYDDLSIPNRKSKYYDDHKKFFLSKIKKNKIKNIFFIGKNKSNMYFFKQLLDENECIVSYKLNELLLEFDISGCKF